MSEAYNLPPGTASALNDHIAQCKNLSLILEKYPPERVVRDTKNKGSWLQSLIQTTPLDATLAQAAYNRWQTMLTVLGAE